MTDITNFYLAGWKNLQEVQIPPAKEKGFSQEIIQRTKIEPKKRLANQDDPTVNYATDLAGKIKNDDDKTFYIWNRINDMDEDKTVLLQSSDAYADEEATVFLSDYQKKTIVKVIRMKTAEELEVCKDTFVIGKSKDCDFVITENPTISRRHVEIKKVNGEYYLYDLESANHTYVNDMELIDPLKITGNILFRMSDEEFIITVEKN